MLDIHDGLHSTYKPRFNLKKGQSSKLFFTASIRTLFQNIFSMSLQTHDKPKYKELLKIGLISTNRP